MIVARWVVTQHWKLLARQRKIRLFCAAAVSVCRVPRVNDSGRPSPESLPHVLRSTGGIRAVRNSSDVTERFWGGNNYLGNPNSCPGACPSTLFFRLSKLLLVFDHDLRGKTGRSCSSPTVECLAFDLYEYSSRSFYTATTTTTNLELLMDSHRPLMFAYG